MSLCRTPGCEREATHGLDPIAQCFSCWNLGRTPVRQGPPRWSDPETLADVREQLRYGCILRVGRRHE